jgi:carbon storage regulator
MLVLTRKKKQSVMLGEDIEIQVLEVNGEQVRLGIKAPVSLRIFRKEIYNEIHAQNQAAVVTTPMELKNMQAAARGEQSKPEGGESLEG